MIIVSFGERKGACVWRDEMRTKLPIFLDQKRNSYRALGMKRSFSKVIHANLNVTGFRPFLSPRGNAATVSQID